LEVKPDWNTIYSGHSYVQLKVTTGLCQFHTKIKKNYYKNHTADQNGKASIDGRWEDEEEKPPTPKK
jgi:hypothetical protein